MSLIAGALPGSLLVSGFTSNFSILDWGIVGVYILGTAVIGWYARRYIKDMDDYVVAGRSLRSFVSVATMVGSELGLITVMYAAQKGFTGGFAAFHIGAIAFVVTLIVGLTGFIVVPLRKRGVKTIPEFYAQRFSPGVRIYGGAILALAGILNMGLFLKAGGLFVTGLTGLEGVWVISEDVEIPWINVVMTVLMLLVLFYTILGGMVSVVITDYIQFVVLAISLLLTAYLAVDFLGWEGIVTEVRRIHGEAGFDPFHEQGFGVSYVVWMLFTAGLVSCAVWQTAVMRACAAESAGVVRKMYAISSVGFMIRFLLPQFLGICALVFMAQSDAGRALFFDGSGQIVDDAELTMQAMPLFLSQLLPVGLIGLVGAGMLAAFMSTHDSYLLCWASVLSEDVVNPYLNHDLSAKTRLKVARLLIFLIGAFILIWSLWYPLGQDLWDYMAVSGAIYFTGAFVLLLMGLYWKGASTVGAYLALTVGGCAVFGLKPVQDAMGVSWSSAHVGLGATGAALLAMILGSLLFPGRRKPDSEAHELEGAQS